MTTFLDGPAKGIVLELQRTPYFLRAVLNELTGQWDALDQLDDTATAAERIVLYCLEGEPGWSIVCARGRGCHRSVAAQYRVVDPQPADDDLRDTAKWRAWAHDHAPTGVVSPFEENKQ